MLKLRHRVREQLGANIRDGFHPTLHLWRLADPAQEAVKFLGDFIINFEASDPRKILTHLSARVRAGARSLVESGYAVARIDAETRWRLAVGLATGKHSDVASFQLHHLYGVPYLPAGGLKGAFRHALLEQGIDHIRFTGSQDHSGPIVFLDAFPQPDAKKYLEADVNTPHAHKYYRNPKKDPPAEYFEPEPVSFLTVPPGVPFVFYLASPLHDINHLERAVTYFKEVLTEWGAGAKTRAGYGRFKVHEPEEWLRKVNAK